jgi:fatty acid-binding protein DegV
MPRWPWTNSQLKKLTDHVREGTEPEAGLPPYNEVMSFYDDLAAQVQQDILIWHLCSAMSRPR